MKLTFIVPKVAHGGGSQHTSCTAFHSLDDLHLLERRVQDLIVELVVAAGVESGDHRPAADTDVLPARQQRHHAADTVFADNLLCQRVARSSFVHRHCSNTKGVSAEASQDSQDGHVQG